VTGLGLGNVGKSSSFWLATLVGDPGMMDLGESLQTSSAWKRAEEHSLLNLRGASDPPGELAKSRIPGPEIGCHGYRREVAFLTNSLVALVLPSVLTAPELQVSSRVNSGRE